MRRIILSHKSLRRLETLISLTSVTKILILGAVTLLISSIVVACTSINLDSILGKTPVPTVAITPTIESTTAPTVTPSFTPTSLPTKTQLPSELVGASYPSSTENFIKTPGIHGDDAIQMIIDHGYGDELEALESWYEASNVLGKDVVNTLEPVAYENNGEFYWNLLVRGYNKHFLRFEITNGSVSNQVVRSMGMRFNLTSKPSFVFSKLSDPFGANNVSQEVIWDKSGWSIIGAFQGDTLIAWYDSSASNGGEWKSIPQVYEGEPSKFSSRFPPEWGESYIAHVGGMEIPISIGVTHRVRSRYSNPISEIHIAPDMVDLVGDHFMRMCFWRYTHRMNHPDMSYEQYLALVAQGEGQVEIAALNDSKHDQLFPEVGLMDPSKGFSLVFADQDLPIIWMYPISFYYGNSAGRMEFVINISSSRVADYRNGDRPVAQNLALLVDNEIINTLFGFVKIKNECLLSGDLAGSCLSFFIEPLEDQNPVLWRGDIQNQLIEYINGVRTSPPFWMVTP